MQNRIRLVTAALVAMLALTVMNDVASASRSIRIAGGPGTSTPGRLVFNEARLGVNTRIACNVTFLRTLSTLIPKIAGTQFGKVTGVRIDRGTPETSHCERGAAFERVNEIIVLRDARAFGVHRELGSGVLLYDVSGAPASLWTLIYDSFSGTLPEITSINYHIEGIQILLEVTILGSAVICLYRGAMYWAMNLTRRLATREEIVLSRTRLSRQEGSFACPGSTAAASGSFTISPTLTLSLV